MKTADWLKSNTLALTQAGVPTARLDCLVLLEDATSKDRAYLLAHPEYQLSSVTLAILQKQVQLRAKHQPLAYIRGITEFFGRDFVINKHVLQPRPESETMLELLLTQTNVRKIIDVGCGSGALGLTAKLERPNIELTLLDIDPACLAVTKKNVQKYNLQALIQKSNLLSAIDDAQLKGAHLLANLPYVPDTFQLNEAAMNEPRRAIFGGPDGLDLYRELFRQINQRSTKPTMILCESLPTQHASLTRLASDYGFTLQVEEDFIQAFSWMEPPRA